MVGTDGPSPLHSAALTTTQPSGGSLNTNQTNNVVHGHQSGRDTNSNVISVEGDLVYAPPPAPPASVFRKLFDQLENELQADKTLTTFINQLDIYTRKVEDETIVGLENKLVAAGRQHQIQMAMALKENVYANIKANLFSPTYQLIVATLMSKIHERFETQVRPLIETGIARPVIDKAFSDSITTPLAKDLEDCPQFNDVAIDYIRGIDLTWLF